MPKISRDTDHKIHRRPCSLTLRSTSTFTWESKLGPSYPGVRCWKFSSTDQTWTSDYSERNQFFFTKEFRQPRVTRTTTLPPYGHHMASHNFLAPNYESQTNESPPLTNYLYNEFCSISSKPNRVFESYWMVHSYYVSTLSVFLCHITSYFISSKSNVKGTLVGK